MRIFMYVIEMRSRIGNYLTCICSSIYELTCVLILSEKLYIHKFSSVQNTKLPAIVLKEETFSLLYYILFIGVCINIELTKIEYMAKRHANDLVQQSTRIFKV